MTDGLVTSVDAGTLRLRLDRPDKRNALTDDMVLGLVDALTRAATDDDVRVIVLDGAGDHFCGGADIVARNAGGDRKPRTGSIQRRVATNAHRLVELMTTVQVPIVCRVRGWAAGIGFNLALAADFTVATDDSTFWQPFSERGFTPDSGATWMLTRRVGAVRARELLLLGRKLSGTEAAAWGAIHRAVSASDLEVAVDEVVARLAHGPTVALGLTKWLLHQADQQPFEAQLANEAFALELSSRTDDFREGLAAFKERRPPNFEGR
jgi:2-(1,2-epoxy-1,2-dihydrophenyl)acetyl-CoA isomerase